MLNVVHWMNENSTFLATAGHIPSYKPALDNDEFRNMQPNAVYSKLAETAVFDPVSTLAGVASPLYDAMGYVVTNEPMMRMRL